MSSLSGSVLNTPEPKMALRPSTRNRVSAMPLVKRSLKIGSCDTPKKANGAIRAPELVPLTTENSGRFPASVQPTNKPAPNAPSAPPPDNARTSMDVGLRWPSLKGAVRDRPVGSSAQIRASAMPGMPATSCCSRVKGALGNDEQSTSEKAIQIPTSSELINPRVAI
jgi:hypothetical protein